jgi:hypothetical protein
MLVEIPLMPARALLRIPHHDLSHNLGHRRRNTPHARKGITTYFHANRSTENERLHRRNTPHARKGITTLHLLIAPTS